MTGLMDFLRTEVLPWAEHTISIGAIAGTVFTLMTWARDAWRRLPLIEHEPEYMAGPTGLMMTLRVRVYNRSPTMLVVDAIHSKTQGVGIGSSGLDGNTAAWPTGPVGPYVPGAGSFPETQAQFLVAWPKNTRTCRFEVAMHSNNQWILSYRNTIKINIPAQ